MIKTHKDEILKGYYARKKRWMLVTGLLLTLTAFLSVGALLLGNTFYPLDVIFRVLMGEEIKGASFAVATIRLPRMLSGLDRKSVV